VKHDAGTPDVAAEDIGDATTEATLYEAYREVKKSLQRAIAKAKARAWEKLWSVTRGGARTEFVRNKL